MLFKFLCTLCTLVSSSSSLDHHTINSPMTTSDSVLITVNMGGTLTHDLCDDFTANTTNTTCTDTLFEASEKLDFMTIDSQTMLLKPTTEDGACYAKAIPICFSKTYPLTISAVNANDHKLITDKKFTITVQQGENKEGIEIVMVLFVLVGSGVTCVLSSCCQILLLRLRAEAAQMRH